VRIIRRWFVVLALATFALPSPVGSQPIAPIDVERDCQELVPAAYSAPVISDDDGRRIFYDIEVLLDGITLEYARSLLESAQISYTPLQIQLRPTFKRIRGIKSDGTYSGRLAAETSYLFAKVREAVGGERPKGKDAVLLLTDKAFYAFTDADGDGYADESEREYGSIGEAACAGGVRWPETAFALVDAEFSTDTLQVGITTAHELGHLVGGHHHLANCSEGIMESATTPCTTMWAYSLVISSTFSTANAALIRGHAETYASP
jgi:hypothetical protein